MNEKPKFELNFLQNYVNGVAFTSSGVKKNICANFLYDENQCFWIPNCTKYERTDEVGIINLFANNFENELEFTKSIVKNRLVETFKQFGRKKYITLKQVPEDCVVFNNAIIYVGNGKSVLESDSALDLVKDDNSYISNNFSYFVTNTIPFDYIPNEEHNCPNIDKIFTEWVGNENKELLYEIFAYCMIPQYPIHRIFIFLGKGRNGKSKCMELLNKMIGSVNITASDLKTLTETPFGVSQLYNKLICYIGETDGKKLNNTSILKRLSGEDLVSAQFKGKPLFEFKNYSKIIISTNTLPQMTDKSDGNYSRYVIIDFPNMFSETEDVLARIPEEEYTALANICVQKLKSLLSKRKFTNEKSLEEKKKLYDQKANPIGLFIEKNCIITHDINDGILGYEFYDKYKSWMTQNGYPIIKTRTEITNELSDIGIQSDRKTTYVADEQKRYYFYLGVKWNTQNKTNENQEYTKDQIIKLFNEEIKPKNFSASNYQDQDIIKIMKNQNIIYEPKNGIYKLINGGVYEDNKSK